MHILYLHQYFKTPDEPGGTRSYWISQYLINSGHKVTLITSWNRSHKLITRKVIDNINVIYINNNYSNKMNFIYRIKSFFLFMLYSTITGIKEKNIDSVIATSTPLTIGFPALILKMFKNTPYIFEVRDLWPEAPIQLGVINNPLIKCIAVYFEKIIYKKASHIVALSPGMKKGVIKKGVSAKNVSMIPNMAKIKEFWPRSPDNSVFKKYRLKEDTFKIVYFGAMGIANGLDYIIQTARICSEYNIDDFEFIFLGDGQVRDQLIRDVKNQELNNVSFLGKYTMKETSSIVNVCDVSIVTFLNIEILNTNSPNKLFDSLSAGLPIIVNSLGWTKEMVETYDCGFYVNPKSPQELYEKLIYIKNNPKLKMIMGQNARKLAINQYDKSLLCPQFVKLINKTFINTQ